MNEKSTGIVKFELHPEAPLTEFEKEQLDRLREMDDREIDFSESTSKDLAGGWTRRSVLNAKPEMIPLEEDVSDFFKTDGVPDVTRVNAVLREYMQSHTK